MPASPVSGESRTISAFNSARLSANIIHSDEYARSRGYRGGLVPGSDSCGYLSHLAVRTWGMQWLQRGRGSFRLLSPVYEGDAATARILETGQESFSAELTVRDVRCASGEFERDHHEPDDALEPIERLTLSEPLPVASSETLAVGTVLPEITREVSRELALEILAELREDLPLFERNLLVHPGYLIRLPNWALSNTVQLGPWVHVGSELRNFQPCPAGQSLSAFSRVTRNFESKGHRFVMLDVRICTGDLGLVSQVLHTAIYQLRPES